MSAGLRRASALAAIVAMVVGGAKVVDDHTLPGSGFSAVATVAADPTGPTGGGWALGYERLSVPATANAQLDA